MANVELINSRNIVYKDIAFSFTPNPNTGDLGVKKDVNAIKQSILNILFTARGERPFMYDFGGNLRRYLFENFDSTIARSIAAELTSALKKYETRVEVLSVTVQEQPDKNALVVLLEIKIKSPEEYTTNIELNVERIR